MGGAHKLLAEVGGRAMARGVAEAALASRARPVLVVTGYGAADVAAALGGLAVTLVHNPDYATGMASSLEAGVRALPAACDGALMLLGDMPEIVARHLDTLIGAFAAGRIVVPTHQGRRGNPVLWPANLFPELLQLQGDAGAKGLLSAHAGDVLEVDVGTDAIFSDVDTPEALALVRARSSKA